MKSLPHLFLFECVWWSAVSRNDDGWPGWLALLVSFIVYSLWRRYQLTKRDGLLLGVTLGLGIGMDALHARCSIITFPPSWLPFSAPFMLLLWINFGLHLRRLFRPLLKHRLLTPPFAALAGSLAYWGAMRFGAIEIAINDLWMIALSWAVLMPILQSLTIAVERSALTIGPEPS